MAGDHHPRLVRAAVRAIQAMQDSCNSYSHHAGARIDRLLPALVELTAALHSQPVKDEEVHIRFRGDVCYTHTEFVKVVLEELPGCTCTTGYKCVLCAEKGLNNEYKEVIKEN